MIGGLKIVVAEDNALIGMDLAELLVELGHHVCAMTSTEADAVAAASHCRPDLMIVDSALEKGSGVAAMHRILAHGPMPHFFVTGDARDVLDEVPDAVVVMKPFNSREIASGIAKVRRFSLLSTHLRNVPQTGPSASICGGSEGYAKLCRY